MAILPTPGASVDAWGSELNTWLEVAHNPDGTLIEQGVAWVNVMDEAYGATGNGSTDDTVAIQAAMTALIGMGGGALYLPAGTYLQGTALTWNSSAPLMVVGDGPNATVMLLGNPASPSSSITYWAITGTARVSIWNMSFNNNAASPAFTDTNIAIQFNSCNGSICVENVVMQTAGGSPNRVNQGIVFNNCAGLMDIGLCDLRCYVNCVVMQGNTACLTVHGTTFGMNTGSGVSTAAAVYMNGAITTGDTGTGGAATLHITNVVFNSGDRGVLMSGGTGANPAFLWMYDAEFNYMGVCALQCTTGTEVWLDSCWFTAPSGTNAVNFGSAFEGVAYFNQCAFQGSTGHTVTIGGGTGFGFSDCVFGDMSTGKSAANTYDMLNVQGGVSYLTVHGCHFNTDIYYTFGTAKPRSAIYLNSGSGGEISLVGNVSAANSSYGSAALMDFTGQAVRKGNIGLGFPETYTGTGGPVTATSYTALTPTPSVPAYDAQPGTLYKVTAGGHGTQAATTSENLTLRLTGFGGGLGAFVAESNPPASDVFYWKYEGFLQIVSTGSSGTANLVDTFTWGGPPYSPTGTQTIHSTGSAPAAVNTTTAEPLGLYAEWGTTGGSGATITCDMFLIERIAPMPLS